VLRTHSPNSPEAESFIREHRPDIMLARCKTLLKESIFTLPAKGTFVMHPGICPEYRNAHGCFWALARNDKERVGMTLLRVDCGVDTGPVFGYYSYPFNGLKESHVVIQHRVVLDNLDALEGKLREIYDERASTLDVSGRASATWGQPWLTSYLKWKKRAKREACG
jgi:methionyl-tRNA formyltransferase